MPECPVVGIPGVDGVNNTGTELVIIWSAVTLLYAFVGVSMNSVGNLILC